MMSYDVGPEQRKIVGLMAVTGVVGTVGTLVKPAPGAKPASPFRVILGVSVGSALLVVLSELGETAADFATGLASLSALAALLIKGGPMFAVIMNAVGKTTGAQPGGSPQITVNGVPITKTELVVLPNGQKITLTPGVSAPGEYTGTIESTPTTPTI